MKNLTIAFVFAIILSLCASTTALAWDYEDTCVAANEDFIWGQGWDGGYPDGTLESYYGGQSWSYWETPNDGYNLYRDDATDTGNLDAIQSLVTRTPDVIGLPDATIQYFDMDGGFYYMTDGSPDTWYWALAPRGSDRMQPDAFGAEYDGRFLVIIQHWGQKQDYHWVESWQQGKTLRDGVDQIGRVDYNTMHDTYRIVIPEGTVITSRNGNRIIHLKYYLLEGQMRFNQPYVEFSETCSIYKMNTTDFGNGGKWEKVVDFNQIVGGQPVPLG